MSRILRNSKGVTLVEMMVASVILTTAVLGLMGSFLGIQRAIEVSKNKTLASNLAQEKMQILKQKNYYQVLVTPNPNYFTFPGGNIPYDPTYFTAESILEGGVNYTRLTNVQVVVEDSGNIVILPPTTPDTGMRLITITVVWTLGSEMKKLVVNSVFANPNTVMANSAFNGTVTNSVTHSVITGALVNVAENLGWRDTTSSLGKYNITLSPGNYTMIASAQGYFNKFVQVSIAANAAVTQDFALDPMSSGTVKGSVWVAASHIIISQVVVATNTYCQDTLGGTTPRDVEYIEFYNPTSTTVYMGQTGDYYFTNQNSLWYSGHSTDTTYAGYEWPVSNYAVFWDSLYVNNNIPAGGYFLYANTPRFMINGVWITADAYFRGGTSAPPEIPHFMSANPTREGNLSWGHYPGGPTLDSVSWNSATNIGFPFYLPQISTLAIPNFGANNGIGFPKGNQLVRISSPSATAAAMTTYGAAYDSQIPTADYLYPSASYSGLTYTPHNSLSGTFSAISGVPAAGAVITANDGLSDPVSAVSVGFPPHADFNLINVATSAVSAPWTVLMTSGTFEIEDDTCVVSAGTVYTYPSSTTILTSSATQGFIAGHVWDIYGNPITVPSNIIVSPGGAGSNSNASSVNGRYLLRVSTGLVDVVANYGSANANYVSLSSIGVVAQLGQVSDGVDFVLTQGGHITGFVTRDGINALPGVAVAILDNDGFSRDAQVTDASGRFTTINVATGSYSVTPELDSLETSSPTTQSVTVLSGQNVFSATFTVTGALGTITGAVSSGGSPISTGVLIVVTTTSLAGTPPAPPSLSSNTLTSNSYYITSSKEDGTYTVDVRQSTSTTYNVYAYYTTLTSTGGITTQSSTLSSISILAGQTISGKNFAW